MGLCLSLSALACSGDDAGTTGQMPFNGGNDPATAGNGGDTNAGNGNAGNGSDGADAGNGDNVTRDAGSSDPGDEADAGSGEPGADAGEPNDGDAGSTPDKDAGSGEPDAGGGVTPPALVDGCAGQKLREGIPSDLSARGPWPVGAVTTTLGGVRAEVWYPGQIGSDAQKPDVIYSLEDQLPDSEKGKIKPEARSPRQVCDCKRGLPLDAEAGPYPVLVFVHGTAGFRTTNLENTVHWASRGFVVVAADHPGIQLKDMLGGFGLGGGGSNQAGDARRMLEALATPSGDLAFLAGHLDLTRVGAMGHSAGAQAVSGLGNVADVIIPYAGGNAVTQDRVKSAMFVTGDKDAVVAPSTNGYDGTTTKPKRRVWIKDGGHLVGGSLCVIRDPTDPTKDIVALANEFQIGNLLLRPFFGTLFDGCNTTPDATDGDFIPASRGIEILSYVSTGQFEEALHCSASATAELARTQEVFGADVSAYVAELP
jgi:fermentation-respiration switch protein FrsA (DUF1100 family)